MTPAQLALLLELGIQRARDAESEGIAGPLRSLDAHLSEAERWNELVREARAS